MRAGHDRCYSQFGVWLVLALLGSLPVSLGQFFSHLAKSPTPPICVEEDDRWIGPFFPTRPKSLDEVHIRQYTGDNMCNWTEVHLKDFDSLLKAPLYDANRTTLFYVHGFGENPLRPSARGITRSYLKRRHEYDFFLLNWNNMAFYSYFFNAIPNSRKVAYEVARRLARLFHRRRLIIERFHLMGHSLGGQLANMIAEYLQASGFVVPRLTLLDPIGFWPLRDEHLGLSLNRNAAKFMDVLHTYGGVVGTTFNVGHVDFWPNSSPLQVQPGCIENFRWYNAWMDFYCSHRRSWEYWVESMDNPKAFRASSSKSCFRKNRTDFCEMQLIPVYMGFGVNTSLRGVYHLLTNKESPYGRGDSGSCVCR